MTVELTSIGEAAGVVLPDKLLKRLRLALGDHLYVLETRNGIELLPSTPDLIRQMEVAEQVMSEDRDVLERLAE